MKQSKIYVPRSNWLWKVRMILMMPTQRISLIRCWLLPMLLGLAALSQAQTFSEVERRTTLLFEQANWSQLIEEGTVALDAGFDYLGLHYRVGVANYEQAQYFKSAHHFEKVLQYDRFHRNALEYLYYSYLFSGRERTAHLLAADFPPGLYAKIGHKRYQLFNYVYLEGGAKQSSFTDSITAMPFLTLGLHHRLGYRLDLYHSVSYLSQIYFQTDFRQLEYYARADWQLGPGITVHPAFHYVDLSGDLASSLDAQVKDPLEQTVWAGYLGMTITQNRLRIQPYYAITRSQTNILYRSLDSATSFQGDSNTSQYGMKLTYASPIFKDRLWLYGQLAGQDLAGSYSTLWGAGLSLYLSPSLAIHSNYFSSGGAYQFVEAQAAILNNAVDRIEGRWSGTMEYCLGLQSSILLGFQRENKSINSDLFYYNTLFLGIKLGL